MAKIVCKPVQKYAQLANSVSVQMDIMRTMAQVLINGHLTVV